MSATVMPAMGHCPGLDGEIAEVRPGTGFECQGLRVARQQVTASNIANADTPNYTARDFDFSSALRSALDGRGGATAVSVTAPRHIVPQSAALGATQLAYRVPPQASLDGNSVDMDVERNQFTDNAIRYEAGISLINSQIRGLMAAIQGGQ